MSRMNLASNRQWGPSRFDPDWQRSGLYNDAVRQGTTDGKVTTIVRHLGPASLSLPPFGYEWEIFLLSGDFEVDGERMRPGDHCLVAAGEAISGNTAGGCEYLVIAR